MNINDQIRILQQQLNDIDKQLRALQRLDVNPPADLTGYALLAGRAGGQTLKGGTASGEDLTLESTSHATKGTVFINPNGGDAQVGKTGTVATFGDGTGSAGLNFNGAAANVRDMVWQTTASARWILRVNADAESGGNAGSNLELNTRTDAGGALSTVLEITRSNGQVSLLGPVIVNEAGADKDVRMEGDTDQNLFMLDASTDRLGFGTATPQGKLHAHDGTGGFMFVTKTGIVGSAVPIIPDGTGDVVYGVRVYGVSRNTASGYVAVDLSVANGGTGDVVDGTAANIIRFTVNANGSVSVARTTGTATWQISVLMVWE